MTQCNYIKDILALIYIISHSHVHSSYIYICRLLSHCRYSFSSKHKITLALFIYFILFQLLIMEPYRHHSSHPSTNRNMTSKRQRILQMFDMYASDDENLALLSPSSSAANATASVVISSSDPFNQPLSVEKRSSTSTKVGNQTHISKAEVSTKQNLMNVNEHDTLFPSDLSGKRSYFTFISN